MAGRKIRADGYLFRTLPEYQVYIGLLKLEKVGRISKLDVNVRYPLTVNNKEIDSIEIHFVFNDEHALQKRFIMVVSGVSNPARSLKIKMFEAEYKVLVELWTK